MAQKLKDLGVKEKEWSFFMEKLEKDVQSFAPSHCSRCLCSALFTLTCLFCGLWLYEGRFHKKLGIWLEEFNTELLAKKVLYGKLQSIDIPIKRLDRCHDSYSWLAISLTLGDAEILKKELIVWTHDLYVG